jgi:hypothetical protein
MATKVLTQLVDDIDGTELTDGSGETVNFGLDSNNYEIDLSSKNADKLRKALSTYVSAARKVGKAPTGRKSSGSGRSSEDLSKVRAWAKENGHEVSERGRIRGEILDAYNAAH